MLTLTIDQEEVVRFVTTTTAALERAPMGFAEELRTQAVKESGAPWGIEGSAAMPDVVAEHWWAHFLDRGTRAHGPKEASRLVFSADGDTVFALFVSGIGARHFTDRAVADTEGRAGEVMARVLAGVK